MITIKHNSSGEVKEVTELEYHMMMDSDAWTVQEEPVKKSKPKSKPKAKKKPVKKKKAK